MGESSVRVTRELRDRLHEARPGSYSLEDVIDAAVRMAGGPEAIRRRLEAEDRRQRERARVARLRREGHPSVCLHPDEQVALAEGVRRWTRMLERRGHRRTKSDGTIVLKGADLDEPERTPEVEWPDDGG